MRSRITLATGCLPPKVRAFDHESAGCLSVFQDLGRFSLEPHFLGSGTFAASSSWQTETRLDSLLQSPLHKAIILVIASLCLGSIGLGAGFSSGLRYGD